MLPRRKLSIGEDCICRTSEAFGQLTLGANSRIVGHVEMHMNPQPVPFSKVPVARRLARLLLVAILFLAHIAAYAVDQPKSTKSVQLTGCLDENPGPQYVLRGDKELRLIALLQPDGFPAQAFAKYLGHRVRVSGQLNTEGTSPVMKVKQVKELAKSCDARAEK